MMSALGSVWWYFPPRPSKEFCVVCWQFSFCPHGLCMGVFVTVYLKSLAGLGFSIAEHEQVLVFNSLWILYIKTKNLNYF